MALKKTHAQFRDALNAWDAEHRPPLNYIDTRRALHACWWFIENVGPDDPARTDIFFELREMVRSSDQD